MIRNLPKNRIYVLSLIGISMVAVMTSGCSNTEKPAAVQTQPAPIQADKQQAKPVQKAVSSTVKLTPAPVNQFDFSNKRDPFKPFLIVKPQNGVSGRSDKPSLPIHSFDVSQFKLIGIVMGGKDSIAQVVDPKGKAYVLRVGKTIGKNEGKITAITRNSIEITEQFRDDNGRVRKENIRLTLPRKH